VLDPLPEAVVGLRLDVHQVAQQLVDVDQLDRRLRIRICDEVWKNKDFITMAPQGDQSGRNFAV
jgi:hypothetical protein